MPKIDIPADAVAVPKGSTGEISYTVWRDGLTVHAVLADGRHVSETCATEEIAQLTFVQYAYLH